MNLKEQFEQQGGNVVVNLLETGQILTLNFRKGEKFKKVRVTLGSKEFLADLVLEEIENPKTGAHNLALDLVFPRDTDVNTPTPVVQDPVVDVATDPVVVEEDVAPPAPTEPDSAVEKPAEVEVADVTAEATEVEPEAVVDSTEVVAETPDTNNTAAPSPQNEGKRRNRR